MKFPQKLWTLVSDDRTSALGWNPAGDGILIDHDRFVECYLKTGVFKTSRMASFVRQLNLYGFRKTNAYGHASSASAMSKSSITSSPGENANAPSETPYSLATREYKHRYFNRQHPETLCMVCRVTFPKTGRTRPPVYRKRATNPGDDHGGPPPPQRWRMQPRPLLDQNGHCLGNQNTQWNNATRLQQDPAHYYLHGPPLPYAPLNQYVAGCTWPPTLHWNERLLYQPTDPYALSYYPPQGWHPNQASVPRHVPNPNDPFSNQLAMGPQYPLTMPWLGSATSVLPAIDHDYLEDDDDFDNDEDFDDDDCFDDDEPVLEYALLATGGSGANLTQVLQTVANPSVSNAKDRSPVKVRSDDAQHEENQSPSNVVLQIPPTQPMYMSPLEFSPTDKPVSQHVSMCPATFRTDPADMLVVSQKSCNVLAQYQEPIYPYDHYAPCYPSSLMQMGVLQHCETYEQQPVTFQSTTRFESFACVPLEASVSTADNHYGNMPISETLASSIALVELDLTTFGVTRNHCSGNGHSAE